MIVVTVSAAYGCGGRMVGVEVARRLGVPFVDEVFEKALADRLAVSPLEIVEHERSVDSPLRYLRYYALAAGAFSCPPEPLDDDRTYRSLADETIRAFAQTSGVIFGRGAAIVLEDHPQCLHVRLDGPTKSRVRQATEIGGLDRRTARHRERQVDHARRTYVRRLYHADITDPRHFDLLLDATNLPLATCVETIVSAARHLEQAAGAGLAAHRRKAG